MKIGCCSGMAKLYVFCMGIVVLLAGCESEPPGQLVDLTRTISEAALTQQYNDGDAEKQRGQWLFGFDLRSSLQEDARQYLPFLEYLEKTTGQQFLLKFTPKAMTTVDMIGQNRLDLAAMGSVGYIKAKIKYGAVILARGRNRQGRGEYRSMLVVRPSSPIQSVKQIKGKRFAFGDFNSTQGHLIPRIILARHGIQLEDLAHYRYTGSHLNCADAVISGEYDVCGLQDEMADRLAAKGLVRIIYRSRYYPSSGIVANKKMPQQTRKTITQALLDFNPRQQSKVRLYHWQQTEMPGGFVKASDADYQALEQWMIRLKFITPGPTLESEKTDVNTP